MSEQDPRKRDCARWRELLALRVDRDLEPDDEATLQAHLKSCVACQGVASWIGDVDGLAAMAPVDEPSPELLRNIERQVMDSVRRVRHRPRRSAWQTVWIPSTAVAAVVALLTWMQSERHSSVLEPPEPASLERARPATLADHGKDRDEMAGMESEAKSLAEGGLNETDSFEEQRAESATPALPDELPSSTGALEKRQLAELRLEPEAEAPSAAKTEPAPAALQRSDHAVDTVGEAVARQPDLVRRQRDLAATSPPSLREQLELAREQPTDANVRLLLSLYAEQAVPEDAAERAYQNTTPTLADSVQVFLLERLEATDDAELRSEIQEALRE